MRGVGEDGKGVDFVGDEVQAVAGAEVEEGEESAFGVAATYRD
tara:strand:+ start:37055 stop:37183 length:129 start_codon:yes stop_codon:yes gene_type:complete